MSTTPFIFSTKFVSIESKLLTCIIAHRRGSIYWIFHSILMKWKTFNGFFSEKTTKKTWIRILFLVMWPIIMTKPNQCDDYNRIEDKWYNTQLNIHIEKRMKRDKSISWASLTTIIKFEYQWRQWFVMRAVSMFSSNDTIKYAILVLHPNIQLILVIDNIHEYSWSWSWS